MTLVLAAGYDWQNQEAITSEKLNMTANPTITLAAGTLAGRGINNGAGNLQEITLGVGLVYDGHNPSSIIFDTAPNYLFGGNVSFLTSLTSANYKAADGSTGISTTITTSTLVGKTITVKNGLITGFA